MLSLNPHRLINAEAIMASLFGDVLHKKRQLSLAYAAMGVLASDSLFLHQIGEALAKARGTNKKHATKQIDPTFRTCF